MRLFKCALCAAILAVILTGCFDGEPEIHKGYKEYIDTKNGFALQYPESWMRVEDSSRLVSFYAPGPPEQGLANFGITTEGVGEAVTVDEYMRKQKLILAQAIPGFSAYQISGATIGGRDGARYTFDMEIMGQAIRLLGFVVIHNRTAFVFTGGCDADQFERNLDVFEKSGNSLRLL